MIDSTLAQLKTFQELHASRLSENEKADFEGLLKQGEDLKLQLLAAKHNRHINRLNLGKSTLFWIGSISISGVIIAATQTDAQYILLNLPGAALSSIFFQYRAARPVFDAEQAEKAFTALVSKTINTTKQNLNQAKVTIRVEPVPVVPTVAPALLQSVEAVKLDNSKAAASPLPAAISLETQESDEESDEDQDENQEKKTSPKTSPKPFGMDSYIMV